MSDLEIIDFNKKKFNRMQKEVFYKSEPLTLVLFHGKTCLWIHEPGQREIPKMEFVGGFPSEWCIFIYKLTDEEKKQIKDEKGNTIDISKELKKDDFIEIKECLTKYTNIYAIVEGIFNKDCYPSKIQKLFNEEIKKRNIQNDEIEKVREEKLEKNI